MAVGFEIWGDSHMDENVGIGARRAFSYELNFRHDVVLTNNNAKAGSRVCDWISNCLQQPIHAQVVVVSSGFNEAVAVELGMNTVQECVDNWKLLIAGLKNAGSHVLWVPTQFKHGRAAEEFKWTESFHILPVCLGADLLEWEPDEVDLCPDRVHHTYDASMRLCRKILDRVAEYEKEEDGLSTVPECTRQDSEVPGEGDGESHSS